MSRTNADRFLDAFSILENEMTKRIKSDRYVSYSELVRRLSGLDRNYRRFQRHLEEFGDLRNAIVHERIDGEVIAEPHLKEVELIEHITQLLTQPESIRGLFERTVEFAYEDEALKDVIKKMRPHKFSKLPIYNRKHEFLGLLTTDAITYYMVDHIDQVNCNIPNVSVKDIVSFDEKHRTVSFLPIHASILNVVIEFERSLLSGKRLNAIILTQDGANNQKPLGIVSISDLPILYEKMNKTML